MLADVAVPDPFVGLGCLCGRPNLHNGNIVYAVRTTVLVSRRAYPPPLARDLLR